MILKIILYGWVSLSAIAVIWFVYEAKNAPYEDYECEALLSDEEKRAS